MSITSPAGNTVKYQYGQTGSIDNKLGRISAITNADGSKTYAKYSYSGPGTITKVEHPEIAGGLNLTYSDNGNFANLDRFGRVKSNVWSNNAGNVKARDNYTFDLAGNRVTKSKPLATGLDEKYTYDNLDRLKDVKRGSLSSGAIINQTLAQSWKLDQMGNWTEFNNNGAVETRTHNLANEIQSVSNAINPAYDKAGNMVKSPNPADKNAADKTQLMVWDAWNRLKKVYRDTNGNGEIDSADVLVATYDYDGKHRRIRKTVGSDVEEYYYDEGAEDSLRVLEVRKNGVAYKQFVWDQRFVHAPICRMRDKNLDGTIDETLYATTDGNYNVTALINESGAVVERYAYDPYGYLTILNSDFTARSEDLTGANGVQTSKAALGNSTASAYDWNVTYTGHKLDSETGLYYANRRYYSANLGKWISRDPLEYVDGNTLYGYVRANPTNMFDLWGEKSQDKTENINSWVKISFGRISDGGTTDVYWTAKFSHEGYVPKDKNEFKNGELLFVNKSTSVELVESESKCSIKLLQHISTSGSLRKAKFGDVWKLYRKESKKYNEKKHCTECFIHSKKLTATELPSSLTDQIVKGMIDAIPFPGTDLVTEAVEIIYDQYKKQLRKSKEKSIYLHTVLCADGMAGWGLANIPEVKDIYEIREVPDGSGEPIQRADDVRNPNMPMTNPYGDWGHNNRMSRERVHVAKQGMWLESDLGYPYFNIYDERTKKTTKKNRANHKSGLINERFYHLSGLTEAYRKKYVKNIYVVEDSGRNIWLSLMVSKMYEKKPTPKSFSRRRKYVSSLSKRQYDRLKEIRKNLKNNKKNYCPKCGIRLNRNGKHPRF